MGITANDLNFGYVPPNLMAGMTAGASDPTSAYLQSTTSLTPPATTGPAGAPVASPALGFNLDTAKLALGGLQTIGSLWQAWEANKLAREQMKFSKDFATTNLANQIQSYNTTLEDRIRARGITEGQSAEATQAYIDRNRLPASTLR